MSGFSIVLIFVMGLFLIWLVVGSVYGYRSLRRANRTADLLGERPVIELLGRCLETNRRLQGRVAALERRLQESQVEKEQCLQNIGLVRYNAFSDVGGQLSFSIALLDDHHDGVVLTGLSGRQDFKGYCKPVRGGMSSLPLSPEEKGAIQQAIERKEVGEIAGGGGKRFKGR